MMPRASRLSLALTIVLALVAAAYLGVARGGLAASGALDGVSVRVSSNAAVVTWNVKDVPARVGVEYGADERYGVWSESTTVLTARSGETLLTGLEPNTTYQFHIVSVSPVSRLESGGSFTTWGSTFPRATLGSVAQSAAASTLFKTAPVSQAATNLMIDGSPVFPRMVWQQCPGSYPDSLAAGINVFMGTACSTPAQGLHALGTRGFAALDVKNHGLSGPGLIGWHLPDEGDESVGRPDGQPNVHDPDKVTFLTVTDHFAPYMAPPQAGRGIYPGWFARADVIGFDTYPIEGRCRFDLIPWVYNLQRTLVQMAGAKPTFQWIEAGPMEKCFKVDPTTASVRAESWLSIAAGARGIGYFPGYWDQPIRATITSINRDIVSLAPALLDVSGTAIVGPTSPIRVGVRRHNGATYVIAVNQSTSPASGRIMVPGLGERQIRVFGENRTVASQLSQITDSFDGLGVHIYIAPPPGW